MRQPFRIAPQLPASAYKTYAISSPLSTHYRDGTCDEAGCLAHRHGWQTSVDEATDLGQRQAHYIRKLSGRRFTERRTELGLTAFTFEAGQRCFATPHKVPLGRPEIYVVRGGDWRGDPTRGEATRVHSGPDAWVNDFGEHQDRLARVVNG
jgi:hypothetical protein